MRAPGRCQVCLADTDDPDDRLCGECADRAWETYLLEEAERVGPLPAPEPTRAPAPDSRAAQWAREWEHWMGITD